MQVLGLVKLSTTPIAPRLYNMDTQLRPEDMAAFWAAINENCRPLTLSGAYSGEQKDRTRRIPPTEGPHDSCRLNISAPCYNCKMTMIPDQRFVPLHHELSST